MSEPAEEMERLAALEGDLEGLLNQVEAKRKAIRDLKDNLPHKRMKLDDSALAAAEKIQDEEEEDATTETNETSSSSEDPTTTPTAKVTPQCLSRKSSIVVAQDPDAVEDWANHIYEAVKWERLKKDRIVTVVIKDPAELELAKTGAAVLKESFFAPALQISGGSYSFRCIGPTAPDGHANANVNVNANFRDAAQFLLESIPEHAVTNGNLYCVSGVSRLSVYCDRLEQMEKQFGPVITGSDNSSPWTIDTLKMVLEQICFAINRKLEYPEFNHRNIRVIRVSDASQNNAPAPNSC